MKKQLKAFANFIKSLFKSKKARKKAYFAAADEELTKRLIQKKVTNNVLKQQIITYLAKNKTAVNDHHRTQLVRKKFGAQLTLNKQEFRIAGGRFYMQTKLEYVKNA